MSISLQTNIITITPYNIVTANTVLFINIAGPATVILPSGAGGARGRSYIIKDISGNATTNPITIIAAGPRLIDSETFAMLNGGYSHIQVVSDGTNWFTI
jgi:hypothetical protein